LIFQNIGGVIFKGVLLGRRLAKENLKTNKTSLNFGIVFDTITL